VKLITWVQLFKGEFKRLVYTTTTTKLHTLSNFLNYIASFFKI